MSEGWRRKIQTTLPFVPGVLEAGLAARHPLPTPVSAPPGRAFLGWLQDFAAAGVGMQRRRGRAG